MQSSCRTASKLTLFRRQPTDGRPSLVALTRGIKSCDTCLSFIGYFTLDLCLAMDPGIREAHGFSRRYRTGPASCLLHHFPEVKVAPTPKRASLHEQGRDTMSTEAEIRPIRHPTHLMKVVPVRNWQRIREPPILVHKLIFVSRQKHDRN